MAAHPQQLLQFHPRSFRATRIKRISRVDQRAHFRLRRPRRQSRKQHRCPPRTRRPANFRQRPTRKASSQRINLRNPGKHSFHALAVAIPKRRNHPSSKRKLDIRTESSEIGAHGRLVGTQTIFAFCSPYAYSVKFPRPCQALYFFTRSLVSDYHRNDLRLSCGFLFEEYSLQLFYKIPTFPILQTRYPVTAAIESTDC